MAKARKKRGPARAREAGPARRAGASNGDANAPFFRPFSKLARKDRPAPSKAAARSPATPPAPEPACDHDRAVDHASFADYMAGVRVLGDRANRVPRTASSVDKNAKSASRDDLDAPAREKLRALVAEGLRFEVADDGQRIEGRRVDVDPREVRRLRRGQYAVDGELDLHGLTAGEARRTVEAFIRKRSKDGDRAVLIVHGKGGHSPRGQGVLRGEIAAWLSQGGSAAHVAAFASPPNDLGGGGAVFVLLAR